MMGQYPQAATPLALPLGLRSTAVPAALRAQLPLQSAVGQESRGTGRCHRYRPRGGGTRASLSAAMSGSAATARCDQQQVTHRVRPGCKLVIYLWTRIFKNAHAVCLNQRNRRMFSALLSWRTASIWHHVVRLMSLFVAPGISSASSCREQRPYRCR